MGNKDYESNVEELIAKLNKLTRAVELFEEENRNLEAAKEELALAKKNFSVYEDTLKHLKENQKEAEQRLDEIEESIVDKVGVGELEKVRESLSLDLSKLREEIKNFEFREGGISNGSILKLVERVERIDDELKKLQILKTVLTPTKQEFESLNKDFSHLTEHVRRRDKIIGEIIDRLETQGEPVSEEDIKHGSFFALQSSLEKVQEQVEKLKVNIIRNSNPIELEGIKAKVKSNESILSDLEEGFTHTAKKTELDKLSEEIVQIKNVIVPDLAIRIQKKAEAPTLNKLKAELEGLRASLKNAKTRKYFSISQLAISSILLFLVVSLFIWTYSSINTANTQLADTQTNLETQKKEIQSLEKALLGIEPGRGEKTTSEPPSKASDKTRTNIPEAATPGLSLEYSPEEANLAVRTRAKYTLIYLQQKNFSRMVDRGYINPEDGVSFYPDGCSSDELHFSPEQFAVLLSSPDRMIRRSGRSFLKTIYTYFKESKFNPEGVANFNEGSYLAECSHFQEVHPDLILVEYKATDNTADNLIMLFKKNRTDWKLRYVVFD